MSLDGLNPPQRQAVETLRGPMLVLAGAGSGKTRVVTFRIARLIQSGISPDRILAVTFTNKAANEMQERIAKLLGKRAKVKPQISTFHSQCVKILRRQIPRLGYPEKFVICDRGDQESLARQALNEIKVSGELLKPSDLLYLISQWKCKSVRPESASSKATTDREHLAAMAYRRYQRSMKNAGAVDFDDLLLLTEELFTSHEDVRLEEAGRFDHLLVDEYQDTNGSQYRIVKALAKDHTNLCVVGDDDQSIYGWRGAEVQHILRFTRDWPTASVIRLMTNYRSTSAILNMANRVITLNKQRHDKQLEADRPGGEQPKIMQYANEEDEARGVVTDIQNRCQEPGIEPRDFCILFRTNEQPRAFETELRKQKVPYTLIGGSSFYDRKEVKDILALFKAINHPRDETSLRRIINTPPRGISDAVVEKLVETTSQRATKLWEVISHPESLPKSIPVKAVAAITAFRQFISDAREQLNSGQSLSDWARALISHIDYKAEIRRHFSNVEEQEQRWSNVEEVINAVAGYEREATQPSLDTFLDEVSLGDRQFDDGKEKQLARNAVVLMTYHSAKGLEFPQVYMVGMEEGILPHHRSVAASEQAVEEERRLCYVGITRAKERLTMTMCQTRFKWGKPRDTIPSRFLFEVIGQADSHAAMEAIKKSREAAAKRNG